MRTCIEKEIDECGIVNNPSPRKTITFVTVYLLCILYITLLSREPSLIRTIRPIPFWPYINWLQGNWTKGLAIALNIGLFISLGYLLADLRKSKWMPVIACLIITISIEVIQYVTYYGYFDADDIISNFIGGCIGGVTWYLVDKRWSRQDLCAKLFAGSG